MERDNHLRPEQPRNMEMLHVWTTHGEKGFRISSKILSSLCRFSIVNANDKSIRGQSPSLSPSLSTNKAIQKVKFLQNIERAQTHLTDRLIKNMKYVKLRNGHFWSELVIYKRNRFNQWRCLTCCKIMGKKDRHRNAVLYPEYFTTFTDDNYIDADGDDEHHGHSAHVYARQYLQREREAQQAIVQTKEKTKCL